MGTKTISTQQAKTPITGSTLLTINSAGPVVFYDIEGDVNSTNGIAYYIQLLGTASPSSGTTVPIYSRLVVPANATAQINGFSFTYRPTGWDTGKGTNPGGSGDAIATVGANTLPVYAAISSTDTVWTSVAASTNLSVVIEETYAEENIANQSVAGDTSTGVDSLTVWSSSGPTHRLTQIVASNSAATTGAPMYLMLFAYATPAAGSVPLQEWTISDTNFHTYKFGSGWAIQQGTNTGLTQPSSGTTYALNTNCYLYGSSTPQIYTATSATAWTMQAYYV